MNPAFRSIAWLFPGQIESNANFDLGAPEWTHVRDGDPGPGITAGSPSICRFEFSDGALIFFLAFEEMA